MVSYNYWGERPGRGEGQREVHTAFISVIERCASYFTSPFRAKVYCFMLVVAALPDCGPLSWQIRCFNSASHSRKFNDVSETRHY